MHAVRPGMHTAVRQAPPWQYWPLGQSCVLRHRTQELVVRSQSSPSGVQVLSDMHLVWQARATQIFAASAQSASVTHATQRPPAVSQTCRAGQSSEFLHVTYGTHFRTVQSLFAGQSLAVTHSAHMATAMSQTMGTGQSRLFRQATLLACFLSALQPADEADSATATTAPVRRRRPRPIRSANRRSHRELRMST